MNGTTFWKVAAVTAVAVVAARLPFRSEYLFSWDSANYALAMMRIDIATHRPHPPGYLGYVFAARAIDVMAQSANAALVFWNVFAAALSAVIVLRMAMRMAPHQPRPVIFTTAAVSIIVTSPLLWFYSDVAEIYPSELLVTLLIAYTAWRSLTGNRRALAYCAVLVPFAALFKLTAAILMLPLAMYAWWMAAAVAKGWATAIAVAGSVVLATIFLTSAPELPRVIWTQFSVSTAPSRVATKTTSDGFKRLNRNARDTVIAATSMLGVVNILALAAWVASSRRLPNGLTRATAALWFAPWVLLCVLLHIGKVGYFLPALPVLALVVAAFYAQLSTPLAWTLVGAQAAINILHFTAAAPLPPHITGGDQPYRSKTIAQRIASDVQPLTFPTASTIRENDDLSRRVLSSIWNHCPIGDGVVVAHIGMLDARRLMWYLPRATVVHIDGPKVLFTGRAGDFTSVTENVTVLPAPCPLVWLAPDGSVADIPAPAMAVREPGVGLIVPAARVLLTSGSITVDR